jgi:hypothetical protein
LNSLGGGGFDLDESFHQIIPRRVRGCATGDTNSSKIFSSERIFDEISFFGSLFWTLEVRVHDEVSKYFEGGSQCSEY